MDGRRGSSLVEIQPERGFGGEFADITGIWEALLRAALLRNTENTSGSINTDISIGSLQCIHGSGSDTVRGQTGTLLLGSILLEFTPCASTRANMTGRVKLVVRVELAVPTQVHSLFMDAG